MKSYKEVAQSWLDGNFDAETKAEVKHLMETDPLALEDAFYRTLEFGTGGLRGIMGAGTNRMNKYTVGMATQGLANYIKANVEGETSVCISYDARNNSELFAKISADVLSNNGIKVYLFEGLRPTPELSYSIRFKKATAGIMVTASHNPKEYNGYKVFWSDGGQITAPVDKDIVAEVAKIEDPADVRFEPKAGETPAPIEMMGAEVDECYLRDITSLALSPEAVKKHADLKIVYTPLHGCGVKLMPEALNRIGFKNIVHVPEQDVNDGNFPTVVSPNPEEPAAMKMALDKADEVGADLVLATDPDADRLGIAVRNDEGKMVQLTGNQTWSFLTYYVLTRWKELGKLEGQNGYVVKTIVTSELIAAICESFGVKCYNVLTGFKYIAEVVKRNEGKGVFICGGEESYGFNLGEFVRDKCAQVAGIMVAECAAWAAEQGMTLWQLLQKVYKEYGLYVEKMVYIVRKGKSGAEEIQKIMADYRATPPAEIAGSPLAKVVDYNKPEETGLPKSNVLQFFNEAGDVVSVRPSGTEPKIKFYFGAKGNDAPAKIEALKAQFIS
jgi:phosphoglucomutase